MKKFSTVFINTILICIAIFCGVKVYEKFSDYKQADKVYETVKETTNDSSNTSSNKASDTSSNKASNTSSNKASSKHNKLVAANEDYRFWIKVDNTNIDYPVVQGKDNSYYLNHDFNKNYLAAGSIFMDCRNDFGVDKSIVIYGHYMKNKTMFGELHNFKKEKFFNQNNKIKIEHEDKTYTYEVFSVYVQDASKDFLKFYFDSYDEYEDYLNYIKSKSLFKSNVDVSTDDSIISLYTCSYEFDGARTIVNGKLISVE